ncbi:hypothetical protein [Halopiger xanaduensis]|uniref:DUF8119 domain-containing protein n=1 Tax=Halopiger xanaduensis (strain DSM 18323 / JCM 14033 / SH-6) TaxID=797210 RepID=F8D4I9_HALXS|nr:hypothetical protein [Halopiger xanaduensis]AEH36317.1 hypothetical protein Halxa_1685 [Halopiger xanaduensis SH-6]
MGATDRLRVLERMVGDTAARYLVDLAVVVVWVVAATVVFRTAGWPVTAYYLVVFGGVLGYSLLIDPWARVESRERE